MSRDIDWFIEEGLLVKTAFVQRLSAGFLEKAKDNLTTMSVLGDLQENKRRERS